MSQRIESIAQRKALVGQQQRELLRVIRDVEKAIATTSRISGGKGDNSLALLMAGLRGLEQQLRGYS